MPAAMPEIITVEEFVKTLREVMALTPPPADFAGIETRVFAAAGEFKTQNIEREYVLVSSAGMDGAVPPVVGTTIKQLMRERMVLWVAGSKRVGGTGNLGGETLDRLQRIRNYLIFIIFGSTAFGSRYYPIELASVTPIESDAGELVALTMEFDLPFYLTMEEDSYEGGHPDLSQIRLTTERREVEGEMLE